MLLPLGPTLQSAAAAYLIASYSIHQGGVGHRLLNLPALSYLGVLSYSIYVWQQPIFFFPDVLRAPASWLLRFPLNVPAAVGCAALSYHALEKPFLSLRGRFRPAEPASPRAPAPPPPELLALESSRLWCFVAAQRAAWAARPEPRAWCPTASCACRNRSYNEHSAAHA